MTCYITLRHGPLELVVHALRLPRLYSTVAWGNMINVTANEGLSLTRWTSSWLSQSVSLEGLTQRIFWRWWMKLQLQSTAVLKWYRNLYQAFLVLSQVSSTIESQIRFVYVVTMMLHIYPLSLAKKILFCWVGSVNTSTYRLVLHPCKGNRAIDWLQLLVRTWS